MSRPLSATVVEKNKVTFLEFAHFLNFCSNWLFLTSFLSGIVKFSSKNNLKSELEPFKI